MANKSKLSNDSRNDSGKRLRTDDTESDDDYSASRSQNITASVNWPRFLIIESKDENRPITKMSPFLIQKALQGLAGEPKSVKKLYSGQLLVEVDKEAHAKNLLRTKMFVDLPVEVFAHKSLNTVKGVVRSRDLRDCSEEEILIGLRSQGVEGVKRISVRRNGEQIPTNTFILTFAGTRLPLTIKAGFLSIPVDMYIPNPLRCFKCQQFAHHKQRCTSEKDVCARCGQKDHDDTNCTSPFHCANCNGDHPAYSRTCPVFLKEKEIQRVKYQGEMSFPEARKVVEARSSTIPSGKSFADATKTAEAKPEYRSVAVQTTITWPYNAPKYKSINATQSSSSQTNDQSANKKESVPDKTQSPKKGKVMQQSSRPSKGSEDPIRLHNRFEGMDNMDTEEVSRSPLPKPKVPLK